MLNFTQRWQDCSCEKTTLCLLAAIRSYSEVYILGGVSVGTHWCIHSFWFIKFTLTQTAELGFPPLADCWGPEEPHHTRRLHSAPVPISLLLSIPERWIVATLKMMSEEAKAPHDIQRSFPTIEATTKNMEAKLYFLKTRCSLSKFSNMQQGAVHLGLTPGVGCPSVFVLLFWLIKKLLWNCW